MIYYKKFISHESGDGLFASKNIRTSTTIIQTNTMMSCLDKTALLSHCSQCLCESVSLKRCSKCKHIRFCSRECQRLSWKIHKLECSYLQQIPSSNTIPSLIRICSLFLSSFNLRNEFNVSDLISHDNLMENEKIHLEYYPFVLEGVGKLLKSVSTPATPMEIFEIYNKLVVNLFTLEDGQLKCIGSALIPAISKLNHSCDPNCVISFEGRNASITAIKDIPSDSEITISYIPLPKSYMKRKMQLQQQYSFNCLCSLCDKETSTNFEIYENPSENKTNRDTVSEKYSFIKDTSSSKCEHSFTPLNVDDLSLVSTSPVSTSLSNDQLTDVDKLNMLIEETENYILCKNWELALKTGLEAVPRLMKWAHSYPSTGLFLAKMGKLYLEQYTNTLPNYKINARKGLDMFDASLRCLCLSLSEKHELRIEVENLYRSTKEFLE